MKRLSADDSAGSRVKVGHRQATYKDKKPLRKQGLLASLGYDRHLAGCEVQQVACFSCEAPVLGSDQR